MDSDDPWVWDIDRVVLELCSESHSWNTDAVKSRRRPNFVTLEAALREQEIDGSTLLTAVDDTVLKNELGIRILGQLAPVKQIIWDLRQESPRYQNWKGRYGSEISLASHVSFAINNASNTRKRSESPLLHDTSLQVTSITSSGRRSSGEQKPDGTFINEDGGQNNAKTTSNLGMGKWVADATGNKRRKLYTDIDPDSNILNKFTSQVNNSMDSVSKDQQVLENEVAQLDDSFAIITLPDGNVPEKAPTVAKERKRIAPTLITSQIDMTRNREIATEADAVIDNDPQNIEPGVIYVGDDGRKRLIPIPESGQDIDLPQRHQERLRNENFIDRPGLHEGGLKGLEDAKQIIEDARNRQHIASAEILSAGYLGKCKQSLNDIFYANTAVGRDLPSSKNEDDELRLSTQGSISSGRRLFVHGLMKRFLRSRCETIHRDGKRYYAVRPYPARLAPIHHAVSFTLLHQDDNGKFHASRQMLSRWPELEHIANRNASGFEDYDDRQTIFNIPDNLQLGGPSSYDNWDPDFLEKYKYIEGGDTILPLYGDSDEEGEYDDETWEEIEKERGTLERPLLPLKRTPLTQNEVNSAIDEGMAQIVIAWHEKKLPKLRRQTWGLWKKSRREAIKRKLIQNAMERVDQINNVRLPRMRQKFLQDRWVSKKQVLRVTKVMELSIFDREERLWQISVINSKREPERPPLRMSKPIVTDNATPSANIEDGECIMTETETVSSYDDDFIEDDPESAEEGRVCGADDEADDSAMSDEANLILSRARDTHLLEASIIPAIKSGKGILVTGFNIDSDDDEVMTGIPSKIDADHKIHISPRLPLRPAPDERGISRVNMSAALNRKDSSSQESAPEIIDLTLLTSEASAAESSPQGPSMFPIQTRKNNINMQFKNETSDTYLSSDVVEVSQCEATELPPNYLTLRDPAAIAKIPRNKWEEVGDKNRLLIGDLVRIMPERRDELFELFNQLTLTQMWSRMVDVMHAFRNGKDRVQGMDSKTYTGLTGVMRLFEVFALGKSQRNRKKLELAEIEKILEKEELFPQFHQICRKTFDSLRREAVVVSDYEDEGPKSNRRRKFGNSMLVSAPDICAQVNQVNYRSPSDSEETEQDMPLKIRKKKIFENAQARNLREQDRQRLLEQEERRKILQEKLARSESNITADQKRIIINDAKLDDQGFVYVHDQISKRIKEHQIDGVKFMWSQIVTNGEVMQGCLLAHTMGLGKTMQVITLLVAIAEAAQSPDPSVSSQIPAGLHESKTLVLCPPSIIDNWMDELLMWAPPVILGEYRKFDSTLKTKDLRLDAIESWFVKGGILIMSYDMFRKLVHNTPTRKTPALLDDKEHAQVRKHLLDGPNIIIADEAHKMKNANASVTQAAVQFRSTSRIALTGSPLANNVVEYHTMIEWIAPNYLGPITEFRAKYVEPIQQGSYSESTESERRLSLKMLGVLRKDLEPKVHRADISVLRADLKPKTEFVITVPLTDLQHKAYSTYVKSMLGNDHEVTKDGQVQQSTLWHWLAILSLLCNHPACFKAKLSERKDDAENKSRNKSRLEVVATKASTSEEDDRPSDVPIWKVGVSEELVRQEMELFKRSGSSVENFSSSNKVKLLLQILDASKAVGDKVLIFSQSIPTLNFLEQLCKSTNRNYARLDGGTKMSSRQGLIKDFNVGNTELYLISTTAGGIGLNLPGANRVIIFDFKFNPVNEEQAVGRAYRLGQQKPVFVYRFVAGGTFEESIHNTAVFKMQLASKVVDKKNPVAWAKKRTGDFLFEPRAVKQQDLSRYKGMDPFVLDKILDSQNQDSTIRAIVMTDTFERHDHEVLTAEEQKEVQQLLSDEKLKRSNKPAWEAMVRKRAVDSKPQQFQRPGPPLGSILLPFQINQSKAQYNHSTTSESARSPILPGMLPTSGVSHRPTHIARPQNIRDSGTLGMMPIAGANTKIRAAILPPKAPYLQNVASSVVASRSGEALSNLRVGSSNQIQEIQSGEGRSPGVAPLKTSPAPDHKRSLSGDQEGSDAADRILRVAIAQYSQKSRSTGKLPDELAISIRKEIERTAPTKLKDYIEEIINLLSGNRELADALVLGNLTASALVTKTLAKSSITTDVGVSMEDERNSYDTETGRDLTHKIITALRETLYSNASGFGIPRHTIRTAGRELVKAVADEFKDHETFEAAADAVLIAVRDYHTCSRLVAGDIEPKDFVRDFFAQPQNQLSVATAKQSDSFKSPSTRQNLIKSAGDIDQSSQPKTDLANFERVAKRRSRLPSWAISDIEKARSRLHHWPKSPRRHRSSGSKLQTRSSEKSPVVDLT